MKTLGKINSHGYKCDRVEWLQASLVKKYIQVGLVVRALLPVLCLGDLVQTI